MGIRTQHCENAFLRSLYSKTFRPAIPSAPSGQAAVPIVSQIGTSAFVLSVSLCADDARPDAAELPKSELESDIEGFASSPRANHVRTAARETMSRGAFLLGSDRPVLTLVAHSQPKSRKPR